MKILFAESQSFHARQTTSMLAGREFRTTTVTGGADVIDILAVYSFDAVVLSSRLDDMRAIEVLRQLRRAGNQTPVMMLIDRADAASDAIAALHAGADDAVSRPVSFEELAARLTALVRRSHGHASTAISSGRLKVDLVSRVASVDGDVLGLTRREYEVLEALALRKGRVITKPALFDILYSGEDEPGMKIIDVFICKLRKKLTTALGGHDPIETVWGRGYVLQDQKALPAAA
jgi:two-component system, cell cycle response regulator CtrA